MKKSKLLYVALLGLMVLLLAACSGDDNANENANSGKNNDGNSNDNGELSGEVEFMTISLLPTFEEYLNNLKEEFESQHPNVTVTINDVPYDQVEQIILTSASSGDLPDVMNLNTEFVKKIGALGALVDMEKEAADVKDTFFEGLWNTAKVNDGVYALPWYTTTSGLIYNPEILEAAGFSEPPTTFEEAWEMSKVIKEKTGAYGEIVQGDMHLLFPKNGIQILNEDSTAAAFNTPEAVELWTNLKEYYDEGLYELDVMLNQVSMAELYATEKVAWWATGPQLFRQVNDLSPEVYEKSVGGAQLEGKAGLQHANPMNIAVSAKSDSLDAAIAFAKFVTNAENQLAFGKEANVLPPVVEAANDEFFDQGLDSDDPAERGRYFAAQALEDAVNMSPPHENVSQIIKAIQEAFQEVLLNDMDVQDALDMAEEQVNSVLD
ncbi:ABC transporter substrate-binding protein [Ornithinibacillus halotolerans]|uniref:Sugar ABC transporter substrate-binding protein n=1 Tax=Ornithinibacillus halotolerans TaxID=1274357 RepID=A0A916S3D3_9BACI|nr:sugar ABC transporter substrate-binding protein [Ornithinibacillus halotolerans]GGA79488.1 sugar ABC transporter substrate-binding protein [Ornithinibacillus halotolerans]